MQLQINWGTKKKPIKIGYLPSNWVSNERWTKDFHGHWKIKMSLKVYLFVIKSISICVNSCIFFQKYIYLCFTKGYGVRIHIYLPPLPPFHPFVNIFSEVSYYFLCVFYVHTTGLRWYRTRSTQNCYEWQMKEPKEQRWGLWH